VWKVTGLLVVFVTPSPKSQLKVGPDNFTGPEDPDLKLELASNLAFAPEITEGENVDE
jgi:hypothetical protein